MTEPVAPSQAPGWTRPGLSLRRRRCIPQPRVAQRTLGHAVHRQLSTPKGLHHEAHDDDTTPSGYAPPTRFPLSQGALAALATLGFEMQRLRRKQTNTLTYFSSPGQRLTASAARSMTSLILK
jgi:hypothetical protein